MKIDFIEGRYIGKFDLSKINVDDMPEKIGLTTTVQFINHMNKVIDYLESKGKKVFIKKAKQNYPGQLLGCDVTASKILERKVDAFLYIGTGRFHPIGVALATQKEVYYFNPISDVFGTLTDQDLERYKKRKKGMLMKFLAADDIGVIISTKPGQEFLNLALDIQNKFPDKNFYLFISNTLDFYQMENFPFIECWLNTACSRIMDDYEKLSKPIVNLEDVYNKNVMQNLVKIN